MRSRVLLAAGDPAAAAVRAALAGLDVEVVERDGLSLTDAVEVMDRLRSPGGCPWDAEQTHRTLVPYLLEECYETLEAIEDGDPDALREELGDLLLQVLFHARIASEGAGWGVEQVAHGLVDKLVRRHPHVFAGGSADDLEGSWEAIKAVEKGRTSVTEGVPLGQPALMLAAKLQRRAERLGAPTDGFGVTGGADGLGGELWRLVARCRVAGLDPEQSLREVARAFRDTLARAERAARQAGLDPAGLDEAGWARFASP